LRSFCSLQPLHQFCQEIQLEVQNLLDNEAWKVNVENFVDNEDDENCEEKSLLNKRKSIAQTYFAETVNEKSSGNDKNFGDADCTGGLLQSWC
jgi:hypothetical protein